jgi:histidine triad (HIT) family protein
MSCIFCRIAAGELPATKRYEDAEVLAFEDNNPVAPTHILVIPRKHLRAVSAAGPEDAAVLGGLLLVCREVAEQAGIAADGFRVVINDGLNGGQAVDHLHAHVLGGRKLAWPPG